MPELFIHTFPDSVLKQPSLPVVDFDEDLKELTDTMFKLMYEYEGLGLAAPQVGVLKQVVVVDIEAPNPDTDPDPVVFINPVIVEESGSTSSEEGCLSVLEFRADIKRAQRIVLNYQDLTGESYTLEAEDLLAICLQHEMDHLKGKLFIDYLPLLKQKMIKKRLKKQARRRNS